ncbi:MAG: hypothetical protein H6926_10190, partial [Chromatiales bacterium]|nr:hypothetical protein [Chromatiales bacterium]
MTTLFPGALDNFTDPTGTAMLGATTPKHSEHHANINDAIEAIEATIGETGSTDPASVEKRLVDVISAAASAAADATSAQAAAALVALDLASLDASIGTAGYLDVGTGPNNVVQLDGTGKLPAVDGSQLTGISGGGGGTSDHGALTGLADDDHTQYHNDARGDARYALIAKGVTNGDTHDHSGGDGAQIDYTTLANLPTLGTAAAAATGDFTAAAHATDTANPHSVTKSQVGLANADNTSDANKPVSTAQQTALDLKANIASPTFTGTVGGITAAMVGAPSGSGTSTGTNTGDSATPAETTTTIGTLINGATSKSTPVDADKFSIWDSVSGLLKAVTWANIKTTLSSTFVVLAGKSGGQTLTGGTGNLDSLTLKATSGNGLPGTAFKVLVGNNGAVEALTVTNGGRLGLLNSSPSVNFDMVGSMLLTGGTVSIVNTGTSASLSLNRTDGGAIAFGGASSSAGAVIAFPDNSLLTIRSEPRADVEAKVLNTGFAVFTIDGASRFVGIGNETPSAKLHVVNTTEQFRLGYDAANYEASVTSSSGKTTKTLVGTTPGISWTVSDATTNVIYDLATFSKNCTGAGAAGLGVRINLAAKSSTTANVVQGALSTSWVDATHATRKGRTRLWVADSTGLREGFCAEADGTQIKTSVNGVAAVARAAALTAEIPGDATRDEL